MKKKYVAPKIYIESFQLNQHLAGSCGAGTKKGNEFGRPLLYTKRSCAWEDTGFGDTVFLIGMDVCDNQIHENQSYEAICYNSPTAGYSIFSS